jgi:signal transduction histidine kinase
VAANPGYLREVRILHARPAGIPAADLALAGVLAVFGGVDVWLTHEWHGNKAVTGLVVLAMALSLAWRRRRPLVTFAVPSGGLVLLSLVYQGSEAGAALFIMLASVYSVALYAAEPYYALAGYAVVATIHTTRTPEVHGVGDALWDFVMFGLAFAVGVAMRGRHARTTALERDKQTLELEHEERAAAAVAEERRRIARELHDIVAHSLGVMVLQAGAAEQVLERDPSRARGVLDSIRATGQEAIGEMSTLLGLIREDSATLLEPQPSLADIERLVAKMQGAGLRVELRIEGDPRPLPAALELSAFRIVQEGLTNALKHAASAQSRVLLRYGERELLVEVSDDGAATNGAGRGSRRGLAGIGERVAVFGGRLDAGPRPEGGWTLRAAFPLAR